MKEPVSPARARRTVGCPTPEPGLRELPTREPVRLALSSLQPVTVRLRQQGPRARPATTRGQPSPTSALPRQAALTAASPTSAPPARAVHPRRAQLTAPPEHPTPETVKTRPPARPGFPTSVTRGPRKVGQPVGQESGYPNHRRPEEKPASGRPWPVAVTAWEVPTSRPRRPSGSAELRGGPAAPTSSYGGAGFSYRRKP